MLCQRECVSFQSSTRLTSTGYITLILARYISAARTSLRISRPSHLAQPSTYYEQYLVSPPKSSQSFEPLSRHVPSGKLSYNHPPLIYTCGPRVLQTCRYTPAEPFKPYCAFRPKSHITALSTVGLLSVTCTAATEVQTCSPTQTDELLPPEHQTSYARLC